MTEFQVIEHYFWSNVWQCNHRHPCKRCCWPWSKVDLAGNTKDLWQRHPLISLRWMAEKLTMSAHRAAYLLTYRLLPFRGVLLCHQCDFAPCCNPTHLVPGSSSDNSRDRRGKRYNGRDHHSIVLPNGHRLFYADACKEFRIRRINALLQHGFISPEMHGWRVQDILDDYNEAV